MRQTLITLYMFGILAIVLSNSALAKPKASPPARNTHAKKSQVKKATGPSALAAARARMRRTVGPSLLSQEPDKSLKDFAPVTRLSKREAPKRNQAKQHQTLVEGLQVSLRKLMERTNKTLKSLERAPRDVQPIVTW